MAKKEKKIRYLITPDGTEHEITKENGKYWVCGGTQWRKTHGWEVKEKVCKPEQPEDAEEKGADD